MEGYLLLFGIVFLINVVPFFMPPTWTLLAFCYISFHLTFLPTVVIGATAATLGRICLSLLTQHFAPFLPKKMYGNYRSLGAFFEQNQKLTIPVVFTYAFFPISSNTVFMIAGLSQMKIRLIAFSFFVGRLISYSFWVGLSFKISQSLSDIFATHFTRYGALMGQVIGIGIVILIGIIDWGSIFHLKPNGKKT